LAIQGDEPNTKLGFFTRMMRGEWVSMTNERSAIFYTQKSSSFPPQCSQIKIVKRVKNFMPISTHKKVNVLFQNLGVGVLIDPPLPRGIFWFQH